MQVGLPAEVAVVRRQGLMLRPGAASLPFDRVTYCPSSSVQKWNNDISMYEKYH
jgi:hypothetical protein